jgi:hypothetical protein
MPRVEAHAGGVEHRQQTDDPLKAFHLLLAPLFAAHFDDFIMVE